MLGLELEQEWELVEQKKKELELGEQKKKPQVLEPESFGSLEMLSWDHPGSSSSF